MEKLVLLIGIIFVNEFAKAVDVLDFGHRRRHRDKECYGTDMGFSFSGSHEFHYESLRRRYDGCNHVTGNLEITNLNSRNVTYDLSFLSQIKVVTGYVLLGLLNVETIPLKRLKLIRADNTMQIGKGNYSLVVALSSDGAVTADNPTPGLKELQMPSLREISAGKVMITKNSKLCHVDTIDWNIITNDEVKVKDNGDEVVCQDCHPDCEDRNGVRRCWGSGNKMCQNLRHVKCITDCDRKSTRCYGDSIVGCCHEQCAAGCWNGMDTGCEMCKYYKYRHQCVSECPDGSYAIGQDCIEFD